VNLQGISRVLGFLLLLTASFLLLPMIVDFIYKEGDWSFFLISALITAVTGSGLMFLGRGAKELRHREGFAIVSLGWTLIGIAGALPFILTGTIPSFTDAVFESISGFTTTGSTIMTAIEEVCDNHHGVIFWRALIQWLGGMGIVVFALAVLPLLGVGGMQLFRAESPGPTPDRLTPRIKETARLLWVVYLLITIAEVIMLMGVGGLGLFDSLCHSFTTMATGGFSTLDSSVGGFGSPAVEWIIIFFMFLAGVNFSLHYLAVSGKPKRYWQDDEFRFYFKLLLFSSMLLIAVLIPSGFFNNISDAIRSSIFQVVSICTTTGYGTSDYMLWPPFTHAILLFLMAIGGCAGSTGGGIKMMRVLLILKQGHTEMKKLLHPRAVYSIWFNKRSIPQSLMTNVLGFFLLFMLVFVAGILVLTLTGNDIVTAVGATAATLGNIGPGLGKVGPSCNFAFMSGGEKWFLSFLMLVGRLEIYTVLILLMPATWRRM
jgi:trk system potassium uptake protein